MYRAMCVTRFRLSLQCDVYILVHVRCNYLATVMLRAGPSRSGIDRRRRQRRQRDDGRRVHKVDHIAVADLPFRSTEVGLLPRRRSKSQRVHRGCQHRRRNGRTDRYVQRQRSVRARIPNVEC